MGAGWGCAGVARLLQRISSPSPKLSPSSETLLLGCWSVGLLLVWGGHEMLGKRSRVGVRPADQVAGPLQARHWCLSGAWAWGAEPWIFRIGDVAVCLLGWTWVLLWVCKGCTGVVCLADQLAVPPDIILPASAPPKQALVHTSAHLSVCLLKWAQPPGWGVQELHSRCASGDSAHCTPGFHVLAGPCCFSGIGGAGWAGAAELACLWWMSLLPQRPLLTWTGAMTLAVDVGHCP